MRKVKSVAALLLLATGFSIPAAGSNVKLRLTERLSAITLATATEQFNSPVRTITSVQCKRSAGDKHDYYSEGTYWWPDPANPDGKYIQRDGNRNPDNFDDHHRLLSEFSWIVGTQTSAYLISGDKKYVETASRHLKAWLVDTASFMRPHLLYAQAIKGICTGRGIGIIDATPLIEVALSVHLLQRSPYFSVELNHSVQSWFRRLLNWLNTHPYGIAEKNWKNNHSTWWHSQVAAYALVSNQHVLLDSVRHRFREVLVPRQTATDGSYPEELARTKPFSYMQFNLDGMATLATLASDRNNDLWNFCTRDGKSIAKSVEFMHPFVTDKTTWPFKKDISDWDEQPRPSAFLFLSALQQDSSGFLTTWEKLLDKRLGNESMRNLPVKNPLLWLKLPDPLENQTYRNPVVPGFNPDPSMCRKGDDYYMVTSTFEYFPGVPVYHSKDLVNWNLIGHALHRPSQLNLDSVECSGGIYAPTIRYNKGTFYMITTLVGTKGPQHKNFIVTATNPAGPWSEPHWIEGADGIDPSLFFDDDGRVYYTGNCRPETLLWEKHRNIWAREIDLKTWKLKGDRKIIADAADYFKKDILDKGFSTGLNNFEAPHLYKKAGWYYLIIAHGGTSQNHAVSVFRSKNVFGPYENNPSNPILTHRQLPADMAFTSTGHLDFVETAAGEWWACYLAKRPVGGENHILGRESFLSPVDWSGIWPEINPGAESGKGQVVHFKPQLANGKKILQKPDQFDETELNKHWMFIRTPRTQWWSQKERKGFLRIQLQPATILEKKNPSFIGRRQTSHQFELTVAMSFLPASPNECAGLVVERDRNYFYRFTKELSGTQTLVALWKKEGEGDEQLIARIPVTGSSLEMKISANSYLYSFSVKNENESWQEVAVNLDGRFLGLAGAGRFTGTIVGMYASSNGAKTNNYVDFDWFDYKDY